MFTRLVLFALLVAVASGCGGLRTGAAKLQAQNALKALSIEYHDFQQANGGRPPTSADELAAFVKLRGDEATLKPAELATLTVQWGAKLDFKNPDGGKRVLASGKTIGGEVSVMMQDGSVKWVSEAAFASAPKAEPAKQP